MNTRQKAALGRFNRIKQFLNQHSRVLAPINQSHARVELDALVVSLTRHEAAQRALTQRRRSIVARRRALRATLRAVHLRPIIAIAHARAADTPRLGALRMPKRGLDDTRLVISVHAMESFLTENRGVFLDERFEDDFVERLLAAANAIKSGADEAFDCRMHGIVATHAIAGLIRRGQELARVFDALVRSKVDRNGRLAVEWRAVNSLSRRPEVRARASRAV
jgi:hypothetical protein